MINPVSIAEKLMFSTTRIETRSATDAVSTGTGFFFNARIDDQRFLPLIITNKHVVAGASSGRFLVHEATCDAAGAIVGPSGVSNPVELQQFEQRWFPHSDPHVDLCAMPFNPIAEEMSKAGKKVFHVPMETSLIPNTNALEGLSMLEDVVMIGYPNGLWDKHNNFPIFRRGSTATHPAVDFEGKSLFVIDAACFPGSSGSPVLLMNEGGYTDSKTGSISIGAGRLMLLGVLHAGPQMSAQGQIVVKPIPTSAQLLATTLVMIHLGYVIKAREITKLAEDFVTMLKKQGSL